jgi:DNA-binding transcriptional MerR regulator
MDNSKIIHIPPFNAKEKLGVEKEAFSTFEIREKLGIKVDRLKDWMNRGFISPSIQKASGQGTKNLFSRWDLYAIKLFQYLIDRGFSRKIAAECISHTISKELQMVREVAEIDESHIGFVRWIDDNGGTIVKIIDCSLDIPLADYGLDGCSDIVILNFQKIKDQVNEAIK